MTTPVIAERPARPYVAMTAQVTMQTIGDVLPGLMPRVFAWLGQRDLAPAGPPFWKYNVIDMDRILEVEVGVPVTVPVDGDVEIYEPDPAVEPDMTKWTTQLAFLLKAMIARGGERRGSWIFSFPSCGSGLI